MNEPESVLQKWNRLLVDLGRFSSQLQTGYLSDTFQLACARIKANIHNMTALTAELPTAAHEAAYAPHRGATVEMIATTLASLESIVDQLSLAKRRALELGGRA